MARASTTAKPNDPAYDVSATAYNALVGDYVSQTDTTAQAIASAVNFTNATVTKSGTALATTTTVSDHAALTTGVHGAGASTLATAANITSHSDLTTGVHGVGAGTVAKTTDITDANLTCTDVTTNDSSITKHGFLKKLDNDTTHFMRGDGAWAVPAGASGAPGAYDYLIKLNGADAEAYTSTGTLTYGGASDEGSVNGADHDAVINAAIQALPGADHEGTVWVQSGDYTISGTTITVGKKTRFVGSSDARLIAGSGINVITIDSAEPAAFITFEIRGFVINMNAQSGHGVYSANAGDQGGWGTPRISDLTIYGVKAAYAGMYLTNIFNTEVSNIHIYVDGAAGKGIVIDVDDAKTIDYGNSYFSNIRIEARANDVVCFDVLKDGGSYQALCLSTFDNLQLFGAGSTYTGTVGLRMDNAKHNTFIGGCIEICSAYHVYLDDCETNEFYNVHSGSGITTTNFYFMGASKRNKIVGSYIYTGASGTIWNDESTSSASPNQIVGGTYFGAGTVTLGTNTATPTVQVPFVSGTAAEDSGWDVDGVGEYASGWVHLPRDAQKVLRIRVYARSVVTEADAMLATFTANAGKDNEAYTSEAISVANKASASTNFAADDVVYWEFTAADDADIGDLSAGDSLEFKVTGVDASGANCATDARFRTLEVAYL